LPQESLFDRSVLAPNQPRSKACHPVYPEPRRDRSIPRLLRNAQWRDLLFPQPPRLGTHLHHNQKPVIPAWVDRASSANYSGEGTCFLIDSPNLPIHNATASTSTTASGHAAKQLAISPTIASWHPLEPQPKTVIPFTLSLEGTEVARANLRGLRSGGICCFLNHRVLAPTPTTTKNLSSRPEHSAPPGAECGVEGSWQAV